MSIFKRRATDVAGSGYEEGWARSLSVLYRFATRHRSATKRKRAASKTTRSECAYAVPNLRCPLSPPVAEAQTDAAKQRPDDDGRGFGRTFGGDLDGVSGS